MVFSHILIPDLKNVISGLFNSQQEKEAKRPKMIYSIIVYYSILPLAGVI